MQLVFPLFFLTQKVYTMDYAKGKIHAALLDKLRELKQGWGVQDKSFRQTILTAGLDYTQLIRAMGGNGYISEEKLVEALEVCGYRVKVAISFEPVATRATLAA